MLGWASCSIGPLTLTLPRTHQISTRPSSTHRAPRFPKVCPETDAEEVAYSGHDTHCRNRRSCRVSEGRGPLANATPARHLERRHHQIHQMLTVHQAQRSLCGGRIFASSTWTKTGSSHRMMKVTTARLTPTPSGIGRRRKMAPTSKGSSEVLVHAHEMNHRLPHCDTKNHPMRRNTDRHATEHANHSCHRCVGNRATFQRPFSPLQQKRRATELGCACQKSRKARGT